MKAVRVLSVLAVLAGGVQAVTTTLTTSGDWFNTDNWNAGVPTGADTAVFTNSLMGTVSSPGAVASAVVMNGGLTVNSGGSVAVSGMTTVGNVASTFGNGALNISGGSYSSAGLTIAQQNNSRGVVNITGGSFTNTGLTTIGKGRTVTQAVLNVSGGIYYAGTNNVIFGGDRTATAKFSVSGGEVTFGTLGLNANKLESTYNYYVDISGGSFNSAAWALTAGAGIGHLNVSGSDADINVSGDVALGSSLTFTAALDASGFSTVDVGGIANLNGALVVSLLDGVTLNDVAGTHILINAASLSGTFASVDLSAFGDGNASLQYDTLNGNVLLNVIPEPVTIGMMGFGALLVLLRRRFIVK